MKSRVNDRFLSLLRQLPKHVQRQARKSYKLFIQDSSHKSLQFKLVNPRERIYSARIGIKYRAMGYIENGDIVWFWIGPHAEYDHLLDMFGD